MVLTTSELVAMLQQEVRILLHLAGKVDPSMLGYRPTPKQRSTLELMQYMAIEDALLDDRELSRSHERHVLHQLERAALLRRRPVAEHRGIDLAGEVKKDADLLLQHGNQFGCGQDHGLSNT